MIMLSKQTLMLKYEVRRQKSKVVKNSSYSSGSS